MSTLLKETILNCLELHERYKGCYFWTQTDSARGRRDKESMFLEDNPEFSVDWKGSHVEVKPSLSISCKNFYYSLEITLDGERKDIRLLKKIIGT